MRAIRVRISTLIGLVIACALGLAALRRATPGTEQVAFTATAIALILATLRAAYRPGAARAYWSGFALAGGAYLALSLIPTTAERLATTPALGRLFSWVAGPTTSIIITDGGQTTNLAFAYAPAQTATTPDGTTDWLTTISDGTQSTHIINSIEVSGNVLLYHSATSPPRRAIDWASFERTGHDLFAWIFGAIGGMVARTWWRGPKRQRAWIGSAARVSG
jgi:hypothetical protein